MVSEVTGQVEGQIVGLFAERNPKFGIPMIAGRFEHGHRFRHRFKSTLLTRLVKAQSTPTLSLFENLFETHLSLVLLLYSIAYRQVQ